jgi:hypothetical protein
LSFSSENRKLRADSSKSKKRQGPTSLPSRSYQKKLALFTSVDYFFKFVSRCEFSDFTGGYFDGGTCLWVPAIAGLALRDGKRAEPDQRDPVPFAKGRSNAAHCGVDRGRRLSLRNATGFGDPVNQISFIHAIS